MSIYVGRNGEQLGPFDKDGLVAAVESGSVLLSDLAWSEGESGWASLTEYAAKHGIALSTKVAVTAPPPMPVQPQAPQAQSAVVSHDELRCPKCRSDNVQAIALIIKAGTQNVNLQTSTAGAGIGSGGLGLGGARSTTTGTSQTQLAEELSEPKQPNIGIVLGVVFGVGAITRFIFPDWLVVGSAIGAGVAYYKFVHVAAVAAWEVAHAEWQKMYDDGFFCQKCGNKFLA
mgnify:CR=1 FL=1